MRKLETIAVDPIACDGATPAVTDYSWSTDFRATVGGMLGGECPCATGDRGEDMLSNCSDNGSAYLIRVRRVAGAAASCSSFTLEVSNGVYST